MPWSVTVTFSSIGSPAVTSLFGRSVSTFTSTPAGPRARRGSARRRARRSSRRRASSAPRRPSSSSAARVSAMNVLGLAHLVGALAGRHVRHEVARELDREIELRRCRRDRRRARAARGGPWWAGRTRSSIGRPPSFARAFERRARRSRSFTPSVSTVRSISSASTVIGSSSMSGVTPTPWIETSPGS